MSTFDFSNVAGRAVRPDVTREFTLYRLEGAPVLIVKPVGETNPAYTRASLQGSRERLRRMSSGDLTPETLSEIRERDRELFPKFVIVGWRGVKDASDNEVPFSADACMAFIKALPFDIFNEVRDFCATLDNFRDPVEIKDEDVEAIAGN